MDLLDLKYFEADTEPISIEDRVKLYKGFFKDCKAIEPVKKYIQECKATDQLSRLSVIRDLNTDLADAYMVSIPTITCWVRDDNYVQATGEIYLTDPKLENFLHQFRHHLQNVERKYERRGLTAEGNNGAFYKIPYTRCVYKMYGEDDAIAWAKFLIEEGLSG